MNNTITLTNDAGEQIEAIVESSNVIRDGERTRVFYCSKWATAKGVVAVAVIRSSSDHDGWWTGYNILRDGKDGSLILPTAKLLAQRTLERKIKSLRKQIAKLEQKRNDPNWPPVAP